MVMEGYDDQRFQQVVNGADIVAPDGRPVVWYLRHHGFPNQEQVRGPDLTSKLLQEANEAGWRIGLLGGEQETLDLLCEKTEAKYPELKIVYAHSPAFRELTDIEDAQICRDIRNANVQVLLIGLGCPKQERWMSDHAGRLPCVMLGVGAAFQFTAGKVRKPPTWIQQCGMEWFFRLCMEPRRLWKRYAKHNPRFVWLICREFLGIGPRLAPSASNRISE
jgi:N-acetylglucosaminyldiphosphoundecaprenol N-acetyl-beta-D-mannosaminyltransferase